jgi:quinol monooxygenase YgiN
MILIVVKQPVKAAYADSWLDLVQDFTAATRAEPGNVSFDWFRSPEEPTLYLLVEVFRDTAAGRAHVESEHFKAAMAQLPTWLSGAPEIIHIDDPALDGWSRMSELDGGSP